MSGRDSRLASYRRVRIRATARAKATSAELRASFGRPERRWIGSFGETDSGKNSDEPAAAKPLPKAGPVAHRRSRGQQAQPDVPAGMKKGKVIPDGRMTCEPEYAAMAADRAVQTRKEEDMRHPPRVWTDLSFEQESLVRLRQEFKRQNLSGTRKLSRASV